MLYEMGKLYLKTIVKIKIIFSYMKCKYQHWEPVSYITFPSKAFKIYHIREEGDVLSFAGNQEDQ